MLILADLRASAPHVARSIHINTRGGSSGSVGGRCGHGGYAIGGSGGRDGAGSSCRGGGCAVAAVAPASSGRAKTADRPVGGRK